MFRKRNTDRIVTKTIFPVNQMETAVAFYTAAGFGVEQFDANYAFVMHQDEELLHLRTVDNLDTETNSAAIFMHVASADAWHVRWSKAGLEVSPIGDEEHGMREFNVRDPSGNLIRVGHNL